MSETSQEKLKQAADVHNLGLMSVKDGRLIESISFFKAALRANPKVSQYWVSYISVLIKLDRISDAIDVISQLREKGARGKGIIKLEKRINELPSDPLPEQLNEIVNYYAHGEHQRGLEQTKVLLQKFPKSSALLNIQGGGQASL